MKRIALLVAALLLSACDATPMPTPELGAYIAQATQDVNAAQTQQAEQTTATAQAITFRAMQTQLALDAQTGATQDAARSMQTWQAITATQQALDATAVALGRLSGQQTATAEMWPRAADATGAALISQAQIDRDNANVNYWGGWALLFGVSLVAFTVSWPTVSRVITWCGTWWEEMRSAKERNLLFEDEMAIKNDILRQGVKPPPEPDETQAGIVAGQWRARIKTFLTAGDALGFSNRSLCPQVLSNRNWGRLTDHLIAAGVLAKDSDAKVGTRWANGVTLVRALEYLRSGATPLPIFAPFEVTWACNTQYSERSETVETLAND